MLKGIKDIREKCLKELFEIAELLTNHAYQKNRRYFVGVTNFDRYLFALEQDTKEHRCSSGTMCPGLDEVSRHFKSVKQALESLPGNYRQIVTVPARLVTQWEVGSGK